MANRVGDKYNRLTIIKYLSGSEGYLCKCDCGNFTNAKLHSLKTNRHRSCGCLPRKLLENHIAVKNEIYKNYKQSAIRRQYKFDLSKDEFFEMIGKNCHYCGVGPSTRSNKKRHEDFFYNGVDRANNDEGYIIENCVPCCSTCNNSKSTLSTKEWLVWLSRIAKYQNII